MSDHRTFHMIEAVADRFEGAPRQVRRHWSDEFKLQTVAETMRPGANVSVIARRIGISPSQLFGWRRDLRSQCSLDGGAIVDPLPVVAENKCSVIEIAIGEIVIRAGSEIDEAHLARVIRAVRAA